MSSISGLLLLGTLTCKILLEYFCLRKFVAAGQGEQGQVTKLRLYLYIHQHHSRHNKSPILWDVFVGDSHS